MSKIRNKIREPQDILYINPFRSVTLLPKSIKYDDFEVYLIEESVKSLKEAAQLVEERLGLDACSFLDAIIVCLEKVCSADSCSVFIEPKIKGDSFKPNFDNLGLTPKFNKNDTKRNKK